MRSSLLALGLVLLGGVCLADARRQVNEVKKMPGYVYHDLVTSPLPQVKEYCNWRVSKWFAL